MNDIKVSVIMPVYNVESYLEKCLNSVINQTLRDIEIICVDDGSTDNSIKILERFAEKDKRITILRQQNLFAGAARNNGIKTAKGKYLVFWDSDDFFEPDALSVMYKKCEKEKAEICLCGAYSFNTETGKRAIDETFLKKRFLPKKAVFSKETYPEYIFNIASNVPWQRMFLAEFIREHNLEFQNLRHANDTYFVLMATYYAARITYTARPLVNYRTNNSQSVTGKASKEPLCAYTAYSAVYHKIKEEGISEKALQSFYSRLLSGLLRAIMLQTDNEALNTVYYKIKNEGLSYFEIESRLDSEYYYFKSDYEDIMFIRNHELSEFLIYKYRKENAGRLYYKQKAEKSFKIRLARKISLLVSPNSKLYDIGKKFLHFK